MKPVEGQRPTASLRYSVIIPVHDDAEPLRACLESLGELPEGSEILVIDDGSSDHPERVTADHPAELIRLERQSGAAAARNAGARHARGEILLFTDADCLVMAGWAEALEAALLEANRRDPRCVALGGRLDSASGYAAKSHAYAGYAYVQGGPERRTDCFNTANAAIFRQVFMDLGGFYEVLAAHEDHDFGLRLASSPHHARFVPDIEVYHDHGVETLPAMLGKHGFWGRTAGLRIEERHPGRLGRFLPWLRRGWSHGLLIVPLAVVSSAKIIAHLLAFDRRALFYAPGILLAKLAFRVNAFRFRHET